jgi:DNA polymerase
MENKWLGTSGPRDAKIVIVGESWGAEEARRQLPFVGNTGNELDKMLAEAGISRQSCFITNVVPAQPPGNRMWEFMRETKEARLAEMKAIRGLYPNQQVLNGVDNLCYQLSEVKPEVIIGFGNYALWALTESDFRIKDEHSRKVPVGIGAWRGSQLYCSEDMGGFRLMPTYHPATIFHSWPWRYDIVHDLKSRLPKALNGQWDPPAYNFRIRPSFSDVLAWLEKLIVEAEDRKDPQWLGVDLETAHGYISCIGIAWSDLDALCIPLTHHHNTEAYFSPDEEALIALALRDLMQHPNIRIAGSNFLYDAQYFALQLGFIPKCDADTQILQHCLWLNKQKSLSYVSSLYNHYHRYWKEEGKSRHPTFDDEQHWSYNCTDCVTTRQAARHLRRLADKLEQQEQAELQMSQFALCLDIMLRGIKMDVAAKVGMSVDLSILMGERSEWLEGIIPEECYPRNTKASPWYTSPIQTMEILYDMLGAKESSGKKKKGPRSSDDTALDHIGASDPLLKPITDAIRELRSLGKFKTNFCEMLLDPDDRARCFFDPTGTNTLRWASRQSAFDTGANLQTLPKGNE